MPFSHIPKTAAQFKNDFNYITSADPKRRRIVDLMIEVNELFEQGKVTPNGSFLFYKNLGWVRSVKRGSGFFFHATYTMRHPIYIDIVTPELLDYILEFAVDDRPIGIRNDAVLYWEFYSMPGYLWVSALSQGYALELYRQGYAKFRDKKYLEICQKILNTFTIPWLNGGVKDLEWDWYEEYPMWIDGDQRLGVRRVLNCQLDALIMLYRFYRDTKNDLALDLFEKGERELKQRLPVFIFEDGKTAYSWFQATHSDPEKKFGSYNDAYQGIHIMRMHQMFTITGDKFYEQCRDKMIEVKTKLPYILLPYTMQKFGYRTIKECCPSCKLPDIRCEGCQGIVR